MEANNKFSIYPNPFTNMISIDFTDNQVHKIEVVDYLGSILYSSIINAKTIIDLSKFSNGIYLICIDGRTEKIIKN